ncbi:MAG: glutamine synthetase, partial [Oceanospirillaceae bacterium]|nr:glutamine synthetase [Oceanospirillaceae bacterium]
KNVFMREDGTFSEMFYNYLGGLQKYTPHAISFFAPNVNSYRRFAPEIAAPINMKWGIDNRTAGLRIPEAPPEGTRIENRFPGADSNPYLAIAASLACGYLGMKGKLQPTKPTYDAAAEEGDTVELARTLEEGLRLMEDCPELRDIMGSDFVDAFIGVKRAEYETFHKVISSWEREYLLLTV